LLGNVIEMLEEFRGAKQAIGMTLVERKWMND